MIRMMDERTKTDDRKRMKGQPIWPNKMNKDENEDIEMAGTRCGTEFEWDEHHQAFLINDHIDVYLIR